MCRPREALGHRESPWGGLRLPETVRPPDLGDGEPPRAFLSPNGSSQKWGCALCHDVEKKWAVFSEAEATHTLQLSKALILSLAPPQIKPHTGQKEAQR